MPERFDVHIRQLALFAQLPQQELQWVLQAVRIMRVNPGNYVFRQGDVAQGLYMFVTGRAELIQAGSTGNWQRLGIVGPNQYINEAALFKETTETASLRVLEPATILFIERKLLWTIIAHHPELKTYIPIPDAAAKVQRREQAFNKQRDNETTLLDTRRHWWFYVGKAWLPLCVMGMMLIAVGFIQIAFLQFIIGALAFVIPGSIMVYYYLDWQNDHLVVTNERIIHIERIIHTFETHVHEVPLSSIHQINADKVTANPFSRIFNWGTVEVKTAGDAGNMYLTMMADPEHIQNLIFEARKQNQERGVHQHRDVIRAEIDKILTGQESDKDPGKEASKSKISTSPGFNLWRTQFMNNDGETVYRRHISIWFRAIIWPSILILIAFSLFLLSFVSSLGIIGLLLGFVLLVLGAIWAYWSDWDWRNDQYIVGDEYITIIHRRPLWLQNEDDQVLVESVDNVTSERSGLFRTLLNYGNVRISLIGGDKGNEKVFRDISNPQEVQAEITRRQARQRRKAAEEEDNRRRKELGEYISVYHETVNSPQEQQVHTEQPSRGHARPPNIPRKRPE